MVNAHDRDSRASGPGSSSGREHCVVFLGKTLLSHSASLHPDVEMGTANAVSEYSAVNEILLTAKYPLYTIIQSEYSAVNEILMAAKYSFYIIIESEQFAVNELLLTAKYPLYTIIQFVLRS